MHALNLYLEMVDTYGAFILAFFIIGVLVYKRNALFRVFHESNIRSLNTEKFTAARIYGPNANLNFSKFLNSTKVGYRSLLANTGALFTQFTRNIRK